jgi:DNA repair exonuclease SbcCD ATPase subunit
MRPLRLVLRNVLTYKSLDLDVSELRNLVITGENGSGKSVILDAIRVALFAEGRTKADDLATMFGQWGDVNGIDFDYEHGGQKYQIQRTCRRTPKTTSKTAVHRLWGADGWTSITKSPEDVLGGGINVFNATTMLRYRGVDGLGDFGASTPAGRKEILYELRKTDRYEGYAKNARGKFNELTGTLSAAVDRQAKITAERAALAAIIATPLPSVDALRDGYEELVGRLALARAQRESEIAETRRHTDAVAAARVVRDNRDDEHKAADARVRECAARVQELEVLLADETKVRTAAARKAVLTSEYTDAKQRRADAVAAVTAATVALRDANAALVAAQNANAIAASRARYQKAMDAAAARLAVLTPAMVANDALRAADVALAAGKLAAETAAKIDSLTAELAKVDQDIAILSPLVTAVREAIAKNTALTADTARAAELPSVPCGGEGKHATCKFLIEAVAARDRLEGARAQVAELVTAIESAGRQDVTTAFAAGQWLPLQSALTALTGRRSSLAATLASCGPRPTVVDVEALAVAWAQAEAASDAATAAAGARNVTAATVALVQREHDAAESALAATAPVTEVDAAPLTAAVIDADRAAKDAQAVVLAIDSEIEKIVAEGKTLTDLAAKLTEVERAGATLTEAESTYQTLRALAAEAAARAADASAEHARLRDTERPKMPVDVTTLAAEVEDAKRKISAAEKLTVEHAAAVKRDADLAVEYTTSATDSAASAKRKAVAALLAKFYADAPSLVIENDRDEIERQANEWLSRTSSLAVELSLQRPQKTNASKVHETLDINVTRPSGKSRRETCSAGELFRVDIGLAAGISQALGSGRAWLAVDEGFGSLKEDVLTSVVRGLQDMIAELDGLWVIEHNPLVIDVFPNRLHVRSTPEGSVVDVYRS